MTFSLDPPIVDEPARLRALRVVRSLRELTAELDKLTSAILVAAPVPDDPHARCSTCGQLSKRPYAHTCVVCGETFTARTPRAKYCSGRCRTHSSRRRHG